MDVKRIASQTTYIDTEDRDFDEATVTGANVVWALWRIVATLDGPVRQITVTFPKVADAGENLDGVTIRTKK